MFLQETLACRPSVVDKSSSKWKGKSFWSPALGKQGGDSILVSKTCDFAILQWKKDSSGQILSLFVSLADMRFNLINVYVHTNLNEKKVFYNELQPFLFPTSYKIIAGDFNCVEGQFDKFGENLTLSSDLKDLRLAHDLIDIWQKAHG